MDIFDILTKTNHLSKQIEPILGENPSWASVEDAKDELLILLMMTLD
jgi:hypothetical protein